MAKTNYNQMELEELIILMNIKLKEQEILKNENTLMSIGRQVQIISELAEIFESAGYKMLELSDSLKGNVRRS